MTAPERTGAVSRPVLSVFYDGSCPMCVREVAVYRRQSPGDIAWHDLSAPGLVVPRDSRGVQPTHAALMARFHVHSTEGGWFSGASAFTRVWQRLGLFWKTVALVGRIPGGLRLMDAVYALFLRIRPRLQRLVGGLTRAAAFPAVMTPAIRSDHAGETGAVWIYRAMLALSRDRQIRPLLEEHARQEKIHLEAMERLLPWRERSWLLPLWRGAGALTGAIAAMGGRRWILATIAAVERFVDRHYAEQIEQLRDLMAAAGESPDNRLCTAPMPLDALAASPCAQGECAATGSGGAILLTILESFRADECRHRDEALDLLRPDPAIGSPPEAQAPLTASPVLAMWCRLVDVGSRLAVRAAKAI